MLDAVLRNSAFKKRQLYEQFDGGRESKKEITEEKPYLGSENHQNVQNKQKHGHMSVD